MKKTLVVLTAFGLALLVQASGQDRAANRSMEEVRSADLKTAFNAEADRVRVVSLLSPTCTVCQKGHGAIRDIFADVKSKRLKAFLVWLPILDEDSASMAASQATQLRDGRIVLQGWDGRREIGDLFSKTLGLEKTAWDVYLVYKPGIRWTGPNPPAPTYWMHQLRRDKGASPKRCLNLAKLKHEIRSLL